MPGVRDTVLHAFCPGLVVGVRHAGIPITVVDDNPVGLDQSRVGVAGQVGARAGVVDLVGAGRPAEGRRHDVRRGHHFRLSEIPGGGTGVDASVRPTDSLVEGNLGSNLAIHLLLGALETLAIDVVEVDVPNNGRHLVQKGCTLRSHRSVEVAGCDDLLLQRRRNEGLSKQILGVILLPLATANADLSPCASVSNRNPSEFRPGVRGVTLSEQNCLCQGGHVHTCVTLPSNKKPVRLELGIQLEELLHSQQIVSGSLVIIGVVVCLVV
mmetsp:Transcript_32795/g.74949  ORF Transcript_32795/g.74949 Transcript_32795/m.74949 type:complete len:268 (-) Transcript_32795:404-1207(-)